MCTVLLAFGRVFARGPWGRLFAGCMLLVLSLGCRPDQGEGDRQADEFRLNVLLIAYVESGECLHSRRQAADLGVLRCVPAPRAACRDDILQDTTGNLIVSSATADRARAELARIATDAPACQEEVATVLALPTFRATSQSNYESIRASNRLELVGACRDLGTDETAKLASRWAYGFLTSARGHVARHAKTGGDTTCITQLGLLPEQEQQVQAAHSGSVLLESFCYYGAGALGLPFSNDRCSAAERDAAHIFDFSTK